MSQTVDQEKGDQKAAFVTVRSEGVLLAHQAEALGEELGGREALARLVERGELLETVRYFFWALSSQRPKRVETASTSFGSRNFRLKMISWSSLVDGYSTFGVTKAISSSSVGL
jgi:hypothetical protein